MALPTLTPEQRQEALKKAAAARTARKELRDAIARGDSYRVLPWQMGVLAKLLRALPNPLFDLMFSRAPQKRRKEAA